MKAGCSMLEARFLFLQLPRASGIEHFGSMSR